MNIESGESVPVTVSVEVPLEVRLSGSSKDPKVDEDLSLG